MIVRLLFELVLIALIILTALTQVIIPLSKGRPMFPYFRRKKLVRQFEQANEKKDQTKMKDSIKNVEQTINKNEQNKKPSSN